ncbi:MAG: C40 family peptidase [Bacteroidetes bacterium]|nr:C40 family peptidase [Bacteroidota bacterium]
MSSKKYKYGICNLSVVPVRKDSSSISELITQLMFGELYTITKQVEKWYYIKVEDDSYNGWVNYTQIRIISKIDFDILNLVKPKYSIKIIDFIYKNSEPTLISMGSKISSCQYLGYTYKGDFSEDINNKTILESATKFLNSPYLWGGKTSLGVDCSGFTQIVYKINNINISRDASLQASQGRLITEKEIKPGDLAFFGESNKKITHVGIMLNKEKIIHAFGKVRIDKINSKGIINLVSQRISHKLICFKTY